MSEERGPSYWDAGQLCQELTARWGVMAHIVVLPPTRISTTGKYTSWAVVVSTRQPDGSPGAGGTRVEYFGQGGNWKTLPAALHAALYKLMAALDERERSAERQARF